MNSTTMGYHSSKHHPFNYPIHPEWQALFFGLEQKPWFISLISGIDQAYAKATIAPKSPFLWRAFELTGVSQLKGIILGQDPYPNIEYANGLAFSVNPGLTIPASLRSIFFELERTHQCQPTNHGDLSAWARQGVLLLNNSLILDMSTKKPPHHIAAENWTKFTQSVVAYALQAKANQAVFMLAMGKKAQKSAKAFLLADNLHIIQTPHPSPLAAIGLKAQPFIGCNCFKDIDEFLQKNQLQPICWQL